MEPINVNKKSDNLKDVIVSLKTAEQADRREVFQNRATGKLNYKKFDGTVIDIESPNLADLFSYKVYTALLTQTGTNAPVATVLENTLGVDLEWVYDGSDGNYSVISPSSVFKLNKTYTVLQFWGDDNASPRTGVAYLNDEYHLSVFSRDYDGAQINKIGDPTSGFLTSIEIRVYN